MEMGSGQVMPSVVRFAWPRLDTEPLTRLSHFQPRSLLASVTRE
jgi:hypothetical protein